jgi:hypothetical protein
MRAHGPVEVLAAVEGDVDEAVVRRVAREVGADTTAVYGRNGKADLRRRIAGYNEAARFGPWVVLVDLNHEAECAPQLVRSWLPQPNHGMCFRVVVRAVEAWLMADSAALARFLGIPTSRIPRQPELEENAKRTMVGLCEISPRREIREDMVPRPGSGHNVGPAYTSCLIQFTQSFWRPAEAANNSDSLVRCLKRLHDLVRQLQA